MQINPYLIFDGRCEAAFKFYEKVLGGKIEAMIPHEGTPAAEHVPAEWRSKIMHARLSVGDKVLMGSDAQPEHYEQMKGFSVTLGIDEPAEAERVFHALAEKGTVRMPIQQTFWGRPFRHAGRPLRHAMDDQLRATQLRLARRRSPPAQAATAVSPVT